MDAASLNKKLRIERSDISGRLNLYHGREPEEDDQSILAAVCIRTSAIIQ